MKKLMLATLCSIGMSLHAQELNYEQGEILVQLAKGYDTSQLISETPGVEITGTKLISRPMNIWKLNVSTATQGERRSIIELYRNRQVEVAQLNHKVTERVVTPDDPLFQNQWQYYQANDKDIDADEAWEVTTGGETPNGDVIVVGVVDNGFNINHPDLVDNLYINEAEIPGNGIDDDENNYIDDVNGWNAYNLSLIHI